MLNVATYVAGSTVYVPYLEKLWRFRVQSYSFLSENKIKRIEVAVLDICNQIFLQKDIIL